MFDGLSRLFVELTSHCNRACGMCGRTKLREMNLLNEGDMNIDLVDRIANQAPKNIIITFHNNGEPLLYSNLGYALDAFKWQIKHFNTNGLLLIEKKDQIIDKLDSLTISVIESDTDEERVKQLNIAKEFIKIKGDRKPMIIFRLLGNVDEENYKIPNTIICRRILHSPDGSFDYSKETIKPEHGICLDLLNTLAIDWQGNVSICVRFDPERKGVLGNINDKPLYEFWLGDKRREWLNKHLEGKRNEVPLCSVCDYWGCPRG